MEKNLKENIKIAGEGTGCEGIILWASSNPFIRKIQLFFVSEITTFKYLVRDLEHNYNFIIMVNKDFV